MKRFITILAVLSVMAIPASALAQSPYAWTISDSSTNPNSNLHPVNSFGVATFYLWFLCTDPASGAAPGMAAAEFDVVSVGTNHLATTPVNGFLNAGGTANLLLAVGGCPSGPVVACDLLVLDLPGNMCLAPSAANGIKGTVDCAANPQLWPIDWIGIDAGLGPCGKGNLTCTSTSVEESSWGSIKSMYR